MAIYIFGAVTVVTTILGTSSVAFYWLFYYILVPNVAVETPIYFIYPHPLLNLTQDKPRAELILNPRLVTAGQDYDVYVTLELPESPENVQTGMFMISTEFYAKEEAVHKSERPSRLRYKSGLLDMISTAFFALPLVLGISEQKQYIAVRMVERLNKYFSSVVITLSKTDVQVYSATFSMTAQLSGLRYWLYHWFFTSFTVGTLTILFCQLTIVGFIWIANRGLSSETGEDIPPFTSKYPTLESKLEVDSSEGEDEDLIKKEPSEIESLGVGSTRNSKDLEKKEELLPKGKETESETISSSTGTTRKRK